MYVQHVIEHQFHVVLIFILIHIYDTGSNFDHTSTQVIDSVAHPKNQTKSGLASCRKHPTTGYYRKSRSNLTPANHKMWSSSIQVPEKHPKTWGNWMKLGETSSDASNLPVGCKYMHHNTDSFAWKTSSKISWRWAFFRMKLEIVKGEGAKRGTGWWWPNICKNIL